MVIKWSTIKRTIIVEKIFIKSGNFLLWRELRNEIVITIEWHALESILVNNKCEGLFYIISPFIRRLEKPDNKSKFTQQKYFSKKYILQCSLAKDKEKEKNI
jgi:hypothetical protein